MPLASILRPFLFFASVLLNLGGPVHAAPSDAAILTRTPPKQLSEFGFFEDLRAQKPSVGVLPFDLNTTLFSDGALKRRFVYVPKGKSAAYNPDEAFEFPVGAALIKTFAFPADYRAPDKDVRLIETRVLLRQEQGWQAWAYVWNAGQTDAELKIAGAKAEISAIDQSGQPLAFTYSIPNKNQCKACHSISGELVPLGPKARNFNRDLAYDDGHANQLDRWTAAGFLSGAPPATAAPWVLDWRESGGPIDARARAWLDVNCAHCHRREGPASNSGLFLTYAETDPVALGINKRPVAAGKGTGGRAFDIVPGDPDGSILLYRVESVEPGIMMPELGRHLADPGAVALLREWIAGLN